MAKEATTFRITPESREQLSFLAEVENCTVSKLVNMAVHEFIERRKQRTDQSFPLIIPIVGGPTLDQLKEGLFQKENEREAIEFQVDADQLGIQGSYPIFIHELTRIGKGTEEWRFVGLTVNFHLQLVKVEGQYNCVIRQGCIEA